MEEGKEKKKSVTKKDLKKAQKFTKQIADLHSQIVELRKEVLPLMREYVNARIDKYLVETDDPSFNNDLSWLAWKAKKGYFADIRPEQMHPLLQSLIQHG